MPSYIRKSVKHQKNPLPDNDDSGNEADSESEGDMPATLVNEPIIACFNNPQCNNLSEDDDEWVINDNIIFNYPASVGLFESITNSSLRMPLHKPSKPSTSVECVEGSVCLHSKKDKIPNWPEQCLIC